MELGDLGFDGFQGSTNMADGETSKQKWAAARSGGFKRDGSGFCSEDDWKASKVAKPDTDYSLDANMLCFSSSSSKSETPTLPYFQQIPAAYTKNAGYYSGSSTAGMYLVNGVKGPFTPSQWLELEQQALIYKYITSNEPIPTHLLIPITKALESAGLLGFAGATLRSTAWGWGPFHLGYSNSTDPEPGRCRRTDGKKWRCSRDAVADHKYCERHMNRGRHRSRKHVEASGNGAAKSTTTVPSSPAAPLAAPGGGFDITHQKSAINPLMNRMIVNRVNSNQGLQNNNTTQLSFLPSINLNSNESSFSIPKHQDAFGFLSSYSRGESEQQRSLYPFMDEWPKTQAGSDQSNIMWPGLQSESTQLSMSIPMGSTDSVSPLRLSRELEMGLGVGSQNNKQGSWTPVSWESSMCGPLGEVLQNSSNGRCIGEGKRAPALNLLPTGWENSGGYRQCSSSPTGVLQTSALVSQSNSSAGSSPRADNSKTIESGSTALAHSSLPASD